MFNHGYNSHQKKVQEEEEEELREGERIRRSQFATPHKNLLLFNDSKSHSKQPNPVRCEPTTGEFFVSTSSYETLVWKEVASSSSSQDQQNENNKNTKLEIVARSPSFSPSLATGDHLCPRLEGNFTASLLEIITTKQHYIILLGNGERGSLSFWAADRSSDLSKWAELGRLDVFAKSSHTVSSSSSSHAAPGVSSPTDVSLNCAKASPDFKKLAVCGCIPTVEVFSLACLTDETCLSSQTEMNKALNSTAHLLSLDCVIPACHPDKATLGASNVFFSLGFCNYSSSSDSKLIVGGNFKDTPTLLLFSLETGQLEEVVPCRYPSNGKISKEYGLNMWDLRTSTSERRRDLGTDFVVCCCQNGDVWRHDVRSKYSSRRLELALKREEDEKRRNEKSKTKEEIEQEQAEEEEEETKSVKSISSIKVYKIKQAERKQAELQKLVKHRGIARHEYEPMSSYSYLPSEMLFDEGESENNNTNNTFFVSLERFHLAGSDPKRGVNYCHRIDIDPAENYVVAACYRSVYCWHIDTATCVSVIDCEEKAHVVSFSRRIQGNVFVGASTIQTGSVLLIGPVTSGFSSSSSSSSSSSECYFPSSAWEAYKPIFLLKYKAQKDRFHLAFEIYNVCRYVGLFLGFLPEKPTFSPPPKKKA